MNPQAMKLIVLFACLLGMCRAAPYPMFRAELEKLGTTGPTGDVYIFQTPTGLMGIGMAKGLEASVNTSEDCTAPNACGVHVHSGTSCTAIGTGTAEDAQGGHLKDGDNDPWETIMYGDTDSQGDTDFKFTVTTGAKDVLGKPFIVHNKAGGRVACGVLKAVPASQVASAVLAPIPMAETTNEAAGEVTLTYKGEGVDVVLYGAGHATKLEPAVEPTATPNSCGVHIHNGRACTDSDSQGGHWFKNPPVTVDPWTDVVYDKTDSTGKAEFIFKVKAGSDDVIGRTFIVHKSDGSRVACGIIQADQPNAGQIGSAQVNAGIGYLWAVSSFALLATLWS